MRKRMAEFEDLPEGCITTIISRTTPVDAGKLSVVSKSFRSASDSDAVWNAFLPSDSNFIDSIISHSPSLANLPTKKSLYLALSDRPIDNARNFQLNRKSGKKCYMLAARSLTIVWGDDQRYWNWISTPDSRFPEIAKLCHVWWFEIRGTINTLALSPNTQYAAYLVFKMIDDYGFENETVDLTVGVKGGHSNTKIVCLDPNIDPRPPIFGRWYHGRRPTPHDIVGLQRPSVRSDGWLEIKMGEFFNSNLEEEVEMSVMEIKGNEVKENFFLEGIEVRPKEDN